MTYSTLIWNLDENGIGDAIYTLKHLTVQECFTNASESAQWDDKADERSIEEIEKEIAELGLTK